MQQKSPKIPTFILLILIVFLTSCARTTPTPPPELVPWAEQYAAAKGLVTELGDEFVPYQIFAYPIRTEPVSSDETLELWVYLKFKSSKPIDDMDGYYFAQEVVYNDHQLATTLRINSAFPDYRAPRSFSLERESMLQIGPQDALQMTIEEGEAYMGMPVHHGNITISLVWDVSGNYPELKNALAPAWYITYHRDYENNLNFLIDAQSGEILRKKEGS